MGAPAEELLKVTLSFYGVGVMMMMMMMMMMVVADVGGDEVLKVDDADIDDVEDEEVLNVPFRLLVITGHKGSSSSMRGQVRLMTIVGDDDVCQGARQESRRGARSPQC
jgi:hypothetical protein